MVKEGEQYVTEQVDGINYVYVRTPNYKGNGLKRMINMCAYYLGVKSIWKKFEKPDVILAMSVHLLTCVAGIQIAKKVKCRCVVQIADLWPLTLIEFGKLKENDLLAKLLYKLEYWVYKNADDVIFTMEGGKEYIKDNKWDKKISDSKIHYINNGIVLADFEKQKENNILNDEHLDDENLFKVVYTGTIGQANALEYLVGAAEIAKERNIDNMVFLIWGDGPKKEEFEKYCVEKQLTNVFFKGKVGKEWIPNIIERGNANLLLGHPFKMYKYGMSMNKIFDYLAAGRPVVSNIVCGYDMFEKYQCGITVKETNEDAVLNALVDFYNMDKEKYRSYCVNAKCASKEFDFSILTDKLEKILKKR